MTNPVLIELTRGPLVECVHRGCLAVARADGSLALAVGDVEAPVFPRSAIKAFQSIPLIESGTAERYGYGDAEIALSCASHSGSAAHVAMARGMLEKAGLSPDLLLCGAHVPLGEKEAQEYWRAGIRATQLHNNCSGKHAGMLAVTRHNGEAQAGYVEPGHPVQRRIAEILTAFTDYPMGPQNCGIDGCSAPNWAIPVAGLARAFARLAGGTGAGAAHRAALQRIMTAAWARPDMVAGEGRLDTILMRKMPGEVFMKTGAEGVYCAGLPKLGIGIALKIDDGAKRASEHAVEALIGRLIPAAGPLGSPQPITNRRGIATGEQRAAGELLRALDRLA